jgi:hypothetical protein
LYTSHDFHDIRPSSVDHILRLEELFVAYGISLVWYRKKDMS